MKIQEETEKTDATLDEIAQMWINIILAHIRSKEESLNKQEIALNTKGGEK